MKRIIPAVALAMLLGAAFATNNGKPQSASADEIFYKFAEHCDLIHTRFSANPDDISSFGHELDAFGTNWEQATIPDITSPEASFARMVVESSETKTYEMKVNYRAGSYAVKTFVNSYDNSTLNNLPDGGWSDATATIELNLTQGKNVVLFQVNNWGQMQSFSLPEGLTLLNRHSTVSGLYNAPDFAWQESYLESDVNMFDPDAAISYKSLTKDSNASFEGAAFLHFTPDSGTTALDLKLTSSGASQLKINLGTDPTNNTVINLPNYQLTTSYLYHIDNATLSELGFTGGEKQILRFSAPNGGVKLDYVQESTVSEAVDPIVDEDTDEKIYAGDDLLAAVKVNGRSIIDNGSICLDWSNSGIEFMVTGTGDLVGDFTLESNSQNTRFAVEIDGAPMYYITPNGKTNIATGISGTHKIGLFKTSEAAGNLCKLNAIYVAKDTTISKPAEKTYKFEIVGDSITCANQISMGVEDAYWGYANQLAKAWNADLNTISVSGRGLAQGFNSEEGWPASIQHQMKDIYDQTSYFRSSSINWDYNAYTPDVVVVGLGSNDLGNYILTCEGCSLQNFLNSVTSFSNRLANYYPNAKIIWCYGSFVNRKYISEYRSTVEALNNPNIAFVEFPQMMHGDSGHPNDLNHDTIAKMLSIKIANMLGVSDKYTPRFDYQTLEAEDGQIKGGTKHTIDRDVDSDIYWSGTGYVGDMGYDTERADYPNSASEIKADLSNVSYIKSTFNAPKDANYIIRIGYATIGTAKIALRVNDEPWQEVTVTGNNWCGGQGIFEEVRVVIPQGENTITFTSALNAGGWINYDFFDVITAEEVEMFNVTTSGEHVTFNGVPNKIQYNGSFSFTIDLDDNYSKSNITVKCNGTVLNKNDGVYKVTGVQQDLNIVATGAELNTWTVHYLITEGGAEFATRTVAVGGTIPTDVGTPTREGYVFNGWDIKSTMPNSDVNVLAKWTREGSKPVSLGISNAKTGYIEGDEFVKPTVTVTYDDGSTKDVTNNATFSSYDMNKVGSQSVTISYTEVGVTVTATYLFTVSSKTPEKKGCGGTIATTSIILSTLALAGAGLLVFKKRLINLNTNQLGR